MQIALHGDALLKGMLVADFVVDGPFRIEIRVGDGPAHAVGELVLDGRHARLQGHAGVRQTRLADLVEKAQLRIDGIGAAPGKIRHRLAHQIFGLPGFDAVIAYPGNGVETVREIDGFLIESAVLSLVGGILGILFGIALAYLIGFIASSMGYPIDPVINPMMILSACGFSIMIGIFFGVYPAGRAAALQPVIALRTE